MTDTGKNSEIIRDWVKHDTGVSAEDLGIARPPWPDIGA